MGLRFIFDAEVILGWSGIDGIAGELKVTGVPAMAVGAGALAAAVALYASWGIADHQQGLTWKILSFVGLAVFIGCEGYALYAAA